MPTLAKDLWSLIRGKPYIEADLLPHAIEEQIQNNDLDYRTRLLIRDTVHALQSYWGERRVQAWLKASPVRAKIEAICQEEFDKVGFPSIGRRLVKPIEPDTIQQFLTGIGNRIRRPVRVFVGGSAVLILGGYLRRPTDDVDVVDEVPAEIRENHTLNQELEDRYGLRMAQFQQHYLPMGWQQRAHSVGRFGNLDVSLLDVHDVALSKLFSIRAKDISDLVVVFPQLNRETLLQRLRENCQSMLAASDLRQRVEKNWSELTGESLPS